MRRIALVRPTVCSVILALGIAPWNVAMAAPAAGAKAPATTAPTTPAPTTPPGETPPGETPPGETPPGETPPGETPPGETPPGETPPGETPPGETPPEETPAETPVETPPAEEAPPPQPPPPDPMADRPPEPQVSGKPRKGVGMMIAGGSVLGVGLAATITFGMVTRHCKYSGPLECKYQDQDQFLIPMGAAVTLLGAMLLGVGVGYNVSYKKWQRWTPEVAAAEKAKKDKRGRKGRGKKNTAFVPAMIPGGGAMVWGGRF
jgi:hypothetical protein